MHQQARPSPRVSSPASSPQTNPTRTNNPREESLAGRVRAGSAASNRDPTPSPLLEPAPPAAGGPSAESIKKLDQIIQNFHTKAAAVILEARMNLQPAKKTSSSKRINKWFQLNTEDFEDFRDDLRTWRNCSILDETIPPLIIETYLDTAHLPASHSLVVSDDDGKRWDVMEALNSAASSVSSPGRVGQRHTEVVLERWRIELKMVSADDLADFGVILPTIYKKIIVFFRSLFTTSRVLPAWRVSQQSINKPSSTTVRPKCRIRIGDPDSRGVDRLRQPLYDTRADVVTDYVFGDLEVPVGRLGASVTYRNDSNFRVDSSESLLSSQLMGVDENYFKPSMPQRADISRRRDSAEVGSLPSHRRNRGIGEVQQTYGSLSTFHGENALATSPITALRAVRPPGSDTSSPPNSMPRNVEPNPPSSLPVTVARPQMRGFGSGVRRPSVSFQPFKAGSLSGSPIPRTLDSESPASPSSLSRAAGLAGLNQPRNRSSLTAGMPASLRGIPPPVDPPMGSPRPTSTSRYSSSFTHRRGRLSFGGTGRVGDDEQGSSGRGSLASSLAQPGSGLLAEAGGHASSGSLQTDDDQISDFLKALDSKKTLQSFESAKRGESATNKTVAQLSKFHAMRDSNNALTESMTSSLQMQRSSGTSSPHLSNVPSMAAPASVSVSSSPGKPLSPHTPHTPAVPSRLSENSVARYSSVQARASARSSPMQSAAREVAVTQEGTTAIDIPISPRLGTHQRRSSSVAQQNRALIEDDDGDSAFAANRSISLGADDREPPTLSMLLGRHADEADTSATNDASSSLQPPAEMTSVGSAEMQPSSSDSTKPPGGLMAVPSSSPFGRRRYVGMASAPSGGRGQTPPHSSRGSFTSAASRFGRGDNDNVDEEPLLFDMSEMDAQGRRSLEEGRGNAGSGSGNRTDFEPRGISRRGW
ncbi:autophagy-related protein 13-domain-containing protein [Plectosphaerella cucumerina]|uniref:Autophagy-related protein 13 n=1 Tax=Plectosphaerella cucumerina TaxID=40658 RepID=A0A8K0TUX2_9PEZI|nr:autophagy-related protein 13-domain-containing protein [Plectosphaerella cucumerina]